MHFCVSQRKRFENLFIRHHWENVQRRFHTHNQSELIHCFRLCERIKSEFYFSSVWTNTFILLCNVTNEILLYIAFIITSIELDSDVFITFESNNYFISTFICAFWFFQFVQLRTLCTDNCIIWLFEVTQSAFFWTLFTFAIAFIKISIFTNRTVVIFCVTLKTKTNIAVNTFIFI